MTPGDFLIKSAAVLAVVAFASAWRWASGREGSETTFRWAYYLMTACLVGAAGLLMGAILTHDFRFDYVIGYSSRGMPLIYLISAFWAGQAGTYLLWALLGSLLGYALIRKGAWEPARVMTAYVPTITFLLALMIVPEGNPFRLAAHVPPDGRGLNLLLQDPWMASHPPLVFLGYAAMTVPAVLALVALWKRDDHEWLAPALRWSLAAFVLLGAGIVLGGFWAYKVLGWGGYWGWDPVENASLVPWVVVTALVHGLLVQKATGALRRSNWALALGSYVLVLYATFLTRSGVLADFSVHSFPAGSIFKVLLAIVLGTLAVSVFALWMRRRSRGGTVATEVSWPFVLATVVVLFTISAAFVVVGTSWPILSSQLGKPAALEPSFYNQVGLPLYVALLALLAVGPFLGWGAGSTRAWVGRVVPAIVVASAGTAAALALGARGPGALALLFAALAALTSNLIRLVLVGRARMLHTGAALAHVGFALMFVGIVASSAWGVSRRVELPLGHPVEALDRIFTFRGHVDGSEPEDRWRVAVMRPGRPETTTHVGMFSMPGQGPGQEDSVFRRPAILRGWGGDLYIAPLGIEESGGPGTLRLAKGRSESYGDARLTFVDFEVDREGQGHGMVVRARVSVKRGDDEETVMLPFGSFDGELRGRTVAATLLDGAELTLQRMSVEQRAILVLVGDPRARPSRVLLAEISTKPLVGVLWAGTLVLGLGCVVAAVRRHREHRAHVVRASSAERPRASHGRAKGRGKRRPKTAAA